MTAAAHVIHAALSEDELRKVQRASVEALHAVHWAGAHGMASHDPAVPAVATTASKDDDAMQKDRGPMAPPNVHTAWAGAEALRVRQARMRDRLRITKQNIQSNGRGPTGGNHAAIAQEDGGSR